MTCRRQNTGPRGFSTLFLLAAFLTAAAHAQNAGLEHTLKAAVLSKFPAFTEWPPSSLQGRTTIDICVVRPNLFGTTLTDLVAGESVGGRPLRVRELTSIGTVDDCHLLFIPAAATSDRKQLLARVRRLPVLTVGDSPAFLEEGGIVELRLVSGRVRFEINMAAADGAGIRLSSQLLRLALNVRGGP